MSVHAYENVSKENFESLIVRPGDVPGREQLVDWYHAQTKVMRWMTTSITKRQWGVAGQARDTSALSTVLRLAARAIFVSTHFRLLHNRLPQCPDPSVEKAAMAMHNRLQGCIRRKLIRGLGDEVAFCLPQIEEVLLQVAVGASRGDHGPITSGSMRKPTAVAVASLSEQFYQGVWRRIVDLGMRMSGRQPLLDIREFLPIPETSLLKQAIREAESDQLGADARPSTPLKASTLQTREDLFALAQELFTPDIPYTAEPSHGWDSLLTQLGHDLRSSITRSHRSLALQRDTRSMDGLLRHVTRALIGIARTAYLAKFYPSLKVHPIVLELRVSILTVWTSLQIWSSAGERLEVLLLRHGLTATAPWRQQAANESEGEVQSWDRLQLVEKATQYGLARMQPLRIILESFESDEEWQRGLYGREGPERLRQLLLCIGGPYARKEPAMLKHLLVHSREKAASLPASSVSPPEPHDDHAFTEQTKESVENDESASETTDADSTVSLDHGLQTQDDGATLDQEDSIALAPEDQRHQMPVLKPALETQQAAEEAPSMVESDSHAALDVMSEMPIPDALPDDASGNADTVMADVQPSDEAGDDTPIWIPTPADHQLIDEALSMLESDDHEAFEAALEAAVNELFYGETDES
ncbi:hypothetical protein TGGT1_257910B [Toxoplasma gondii GT1]|nr:hypothetical protein TGGT1_257910B [Toxoplasma gondii GT1]